MKGDASQSAGATGCGGLLVIDGNASARCGISMKGIDIVVKGSVGHYRAFMAPGRQPGGARRCRRGAGRFIYEARLFVRGKVESLGADCIEKPLDEQHKAELRAVAGQRRGSTARSIRVRSGCYGSARKLYHFHVDNVGSY